VQISDWQFAVAGALGLAALVMGGWVLRQQQPNQPEQKEHSEQADSERLPDSSASAAPAPSPSLEALEAELADAREEAELILLQLHQVQEELEHYFLLSRDLQQQLEQAQSEPVEQTQSEPEELVPSEQLENMRSIKQRLLNLILERPDAEAGDPAVRALLQRQQQALRRFAALHQQPKEPRAEAPSRPKLLSADDELVFL